MLIFTNIFSIIDLVLYSVIYKKFKNVFQLSSDFFNENSILQKTKKDINIIKKFSIACFVLTSVNILIILVELVESINHVEKKNDDDDEEEIEMHSNSKSK